MPKIQTQCPNCQQPMVADLVQLIDVRENPELKQRLLNGALNVGQCQTCGFQGQLPVPLVYHDPENELLLTFTPPGLGSTMEEKESALSPLLTKVMESLPPKERKAYLFEPQAMLTMSNLVKNVLKSEGITEEMIESQQEKVKLLEKLLRTDSSSLAEVIQENEQLIDEEFFGIFTEIAQRVVASQDEASINKIGDIQQKLLQETEIGRQIDQERTEIQAARTAVEELGENLNRNNLLDLVIKAPNETRLQALAGLVRPVMDYNFFQLFTELIESTDGEQRAKLVEKRNFLLKYTQELDRAVKERVEDSKETLENILEFEDLNEGIQKNLRNIDEFFIQALSQEMETARKEEDQQREKKLSEVLKIIEDLTSPPELKIIDQLLASSADEQELEETIQSLEDEITSDFINYLTAIMNNYDERMKAAQGEDKKNLEENYQQLEKIYNAVLRTTMKKNFQN